MAERDLHDFTIIGAGPVGLFAAYYAGLRAMRTKIIDSLEEVGGSLTAIYPEKYIYDVPGFRKVFAKDLVACLAEQAFQYVPTLCLGERVTGITPVEDKVLEITTSKSVHYTKAALISAGPGAYNPKKLPLPELARFEGKGVTYFITDKKAFAGKRVLIVGGGDSAVDWALNLSPEAAQITLVHRSDRFRAHDDSVKQLMGSSVAVKTHHELKALLGNDVVHKAVIFENRTKEEQVLDVDEVLLNIGFVADLGPIKSWGLQLEGNQITVDPLMATNIPGVYAAGDVCTYKGKLKLIATGYGEAAMAANHAKAYIDPSSKAFPGHTSNITH